MEIPRTVGDITPEWLTDALGSAGMCVPGRVTSVRSERIGNELGFVSEIAQISVEYSTHSGNTPSTYVAKMAPADGVVSEFAGRQGMYERETRIYSDLGSDLGVETPELFYGDFDSTTNRFILLMEDLSHLRAGDESVGCSVNEAEAAVRGAAHLHSRWWNSDLLRGFDWLDRPCDASRARVRQKDYGEAWAKISDQLSDALPPEVFVIGEALGRNLAEVWTALESPALTLNHGDYRLANLLFDGKSLVTIDWQYAFHGPPAIDLADFLVWSLAEDQRRAHESSLIDVYIEELALRGVVGYSRDRASQDVRLGMLRNLENYVISIPNLAMSDEAGQAWVDTVSPRMIALAEWDCGALIPA